MALTDIAGFGGTVSFGASPKFTVGGIEAWSARVSINAIKVQPAFGQKWITTKLGAGEITGSCTGHLQFGAADTAPFDDGSATTSGETEFEVAAAVFTADGGGTGCKLSGNIVVSNLDIQRPHNGVGTFSFDWANAGTDMTLVWVVA